MGEGEKIKGLRALRRPPNALLWQAYKGNLYIVWGKDWTESGTTPL